jgi:hypothetical protein
MTKTRFISLGALALLAAANAPLRAQSTQVQLAFGYTCGDRFLVRNEGTNPVVVEYAVAGSQDKSTLHLSARQSAEIASAQEGNVELWVSGKVVASEAKGHRACAAPRNARANTNNSNNDVSVRPIDPNAEMNTAPADSGYAQPEVVVVAPRPYDYYGYGYYPYGYYGYSPFYYPSIGVRVGGFGGFGRGFSGRGRGGRGRR